MKVVTQWTEKMKFKAEADQHSVEMDAKSPLGTDLAMTPKQLVAAGLAGCTAMDVVALMKKHKQPLESFEIEAEIEKTQSGYPEVFKNIVLHFKLRGALDPTKVMEAVVGSQTKYCGVSAMLSKAVPIHYVVYLNDAELGRGEANFSK